MKVVVGLSGGVDSAVCASMLKDRGYEVYGLCLNMGTETSVEDAGKVAEHIGIPFEVMDMRQAFDCNVISSFTDEYTHGRTPNPCLICNRTVKWKGLLDHADSIGAELVATGHYSEIARRPDGRYCMSRNPDNPKDQTYALYQLTQEQLARTIMPLGQLTKDEIRSYAKDKQLPVAHKAESMEICFIPDHDYAAYIEKRTGYTAEPGNFVDDAGRILGAHKGIIHYTVGQRKKLGIALGHPVYVTEIRPETNEVVLGDDDNTGSRYVYVNKLFYQGSCPFKLHQELSGTGKIRYNHKGGSCRVQLINDDLIRVEYEEYQRAVTPGQAFVLYEGRDLMLGGTICLPGTDMCAVCC